jgi:hypothetical protein
VALDLDPIDLEEAGERRRKLALAAVGAAVLLGVAGLAVMQATEPPRDIRQARRLAAQAEEVPVASGRVEGARAESTPVASPGSAEIQRAGVDLVEAARRAAETQRAAQDR